MQMITYVVAVLVFCLWFGVSTWRLSGLVRSETKLEQLFFGATLVMCLMVTTALLTYFSLPFTPWSVAGAMLVTTAIVIGLPLRHSQVASAPSIHQAIPWPVLGVLLVTQGSTLCLLIAGRTHEPLVSPWLIFPASIYVLFFLSTLLCAHVCSNLGRKGLPFAVLQTFIALSVSAIVYGVGFGFDPFIHRAAEDALIRTGTIEPVSLLYSGQYALVGFLHFVTTLPVSVIDIWLLPVLASVVLPLAAYVGMRHGWGVREETASLGWLGMLFVPFMLFTFTVPFTITYVIFAVALALFPLTKKSEWWLLFCWIGILSAFFHPLLGVPIFLLAFFSGCFYRAQGTKAVMAVLSGFSVSLCIGVPLLLMIYQHKAGSPVDIRSLGQNIWSFLSLFANPFTNRDPSIGWEYHALYLWRYWQPILLAFIAIPFIFIGGKQYRNHALVLITFALGILGCIYAVSTLFVFKGIINHEQQEFALRLLQALYIVPIPLVGVYLDRVYTRTPLRYLAVTCLSLAATLSWYFSYPQFNPKYSYYSPSVSRYDLETVQMIDDDSGGKPYLVLSNQMTSAAALQNFGFRDYYFLDGEEILWYAIPTGGQLYQYYLKIIYGNDPVLVHELIDKTQTHYIYVVMPTYWSWNLDILRNLEVQSTHEIRIGDKMIIYRFDKYGDTNASPHADEDPD